MKKRSVMHNKIQRERLDIVRERKKGAVRWGDSNERQKEIQRVAHLIDELFDREDLIGQQTLHNEADAAVQKHLRSKCKQKTRAHV